MRSMVSGFLKWLRSVPSWFYGAVLVGALALVARYYRRAMLSSQARAAVDVELAKLSDARIKRELLTQSANASTAEIESIDAEILATQREIVDLHQKTEGMNATDIALAFNRLGYLAYIAFLYRAGINMA